MPILKENQNAKFVAHTVVMFFSTPGDLKVFCKSCGKGFDASVGNTNGLKATCPNCSSTFSIIHAVRKLNDTPEHLLYAKLILTSEGRKRYVAATPKDTENYWACSELLQKELHEGSIRLPDSKLSKGHNTSQALNYRYLTWRNFFNARQLLALGWLQVAIANLPDTSVRDAFFTLFSGVLEFNNLFTTYKGEGTGAVRHMFAHHILKPERTPIEANVWGTQKVPGLSQTFLNHDFCVQLTYKAAPHEVSSNNAKSKTYASDPFTGIVENEWPPHDKKERAIFLSCGSSEETGLPENQSI